MGLEAQHLWTCETFRAVFQTTKKFQLKSEHYRTVPEAVSCFPMVLCMNTSSQFNQDKLALPYNLLYSRVP